eukprot:4471612-Lingulodinium_polyedra.AAC.1
MKWRARGACVRGLVCRAKAANRAFDRVAVQRFEERCKTMRSQRGSPLKRNEMRPARARATSAP